ncbi:MAG: hypothetical protein MRZ62_04785 [Brachyspira sp.]|nr:hypothetical protein [Brachyspira sp.]
MKNKILFSILLMLLYSLPCYADGGIPLWIWTAHNAFSMFTIDILGSVFSSILLGWIFLIFVISIELVVFCFIDKKKQIKLGGKVKIISLANVNSTIIGFLITFPILYLTVNLGDSDAKMTTAILGPGCGILTIPLHIVCFILSYFIELWTMKKLLSKEVDISIVKKTALWANIWTYFILNPFTIGIVLICILGIVT